MPTFSIVVPAYNSKDYLEECIGSVLHQGFKDWQLVLIDDGSTDGTSAICDKYAELDSRIDAYHIKNSGPLAARSFGIVNAEGRYVIPLDADDAIHPSTLAICAKIITMHQPDIVFMGITSHPDFSDDTQHEMLNGTYVEDSFGNIKRYVCGGSFNNMCGRVFRREVLEDAVSDRYMKFSEDWYQLLDVVKGSSAAFGCPRPLYYYRTNDDSTMHSPALDNYDDLRCTFLKLSEVAREWGSDCRNAACRAMSQHLAGLLTNSLLASSDDELREIASKCSVFINEFDLGTPVSFHLNDVYRAVVVQLVGHGLCRIAKSLVNFRTRVLSFAAVCRGWTEERWVK